MNLNDPFGRLASRDESGYAALRERLREAGVNDADAVRRIIANTNRRVAIFAAATVLVALVLAVLLPKLAPITLALALFLVVASVNASIKGRRHLTRYMTEDLAVREDGAPTPRAH